MRIEGIIATTGVATQQQMGNEIAPSQEKGRVQAERQLAAMQQGDQKQEAATGTQMLPSAVRQIQEIVHTFDKRMRFEVHEETNTTMVRVVDSSTGEILREVPSEKFLDMVATFRKQLSGLFVDELK